MTEINNFITDLLEEMPYLSAKTLHISEGWFSVFLSDEKILESKIENHIDGAEILEGLAALGFTEWKNYYYQHSFDPDHEKFFVFQPKTDENGLKTAVFIALPHPTTLLRRMLATTNPVTEEAFWDHAYAPRGSFFEGTTK